MDGAPALEERQGAEEEPPELELDAVLTFSSRELLQGKDFEQMSADELAAAGPGEPSAPIRARIAAARRWSH